MASAGGSTGGSTGSTTPDSISTETVICSKNSSSKMISDVMQIRGGDFIKLKFGPATKAYGALRARGKTGVVVEAFTPPTTLRPPKPHHPKIAHTNLAGPGNGNGGDRPPAAGGEGGTCPGNQGGTKPGNQGENTSSLNKGGGKKDVPRNTGRSATDSSECNFYGGPSPYKDSFNYVNSNHTRENVGFNDHSRLSHSYAKHARKCYGMTANSNKQTRQEFIERTRTHIESPETERIFGSYRYLDPVYHYRKDNLIVTVNATDNEFISVRNATDGQLGRLEIDGNLGIDSRPKPES